MFTITPKLAGLVAASAVALMAPVAFASGPHKPPHKSTKAAHKTTKSPQKSTKSPQKSTKAAAWSFPVCTNTAPEYEYIYSGDQCTSTAPAATDPTIVLAPASESGVVSVSPGRRPSGSCNGNDEYDYIYSGCQP